MKIVRWPAKQPEEKIWATFNFRRRLDAGETIVSIATDVTLIGGDDASPAAILSTQTQIGGLIMQRLIGGYDGAAYRVRCLAITSNDRVLKLAGILPVEGD